MESRRERIGHRNEAASHTSGGEAFHDYPEEDAEGVFQLMADAQRVDLSYGTYMVLRKPLFFWLRWGGFLLTFLAVVTEAQTGPLSIKGKLDLLFWIKIIGACVYGFLYVKNVPLRVDLAPHRERWLLPQILLGVALSLDLTNLSAFCIPFCVPVKRRLRWCGIAIGATFWGGLFA